MNTTEAILRAMVKCSAWWQRRGINTSDGTCDVGAHAANGSGAADLFAPDCLIDDWDPIAQSSTGGYDDGAGIGVTPKRYVDLNVSIFGRS